MIILTHRDTGKFPSNLEINRVFNDDFLLNGYNIKFIYSIGKDKNLFKLISFSKEKIIDKIITVKYVNKQGIHFYERQDQEKHFGPFNITRLQPDTLQPSTSHNIQ